MASENNIKVGKPQISVTAPSHSPHTLEGNSPGRYDKQRDAGAYTGDNKSTAARSTGINAKDRNPIDPSMPNLSPA